MHNRLLTFERFHQIKFKAQNIDNNSALESEPNSNNRIWALFQFQNHAKKINLSQTSTPTLVQMSASKFGIYFIFKLLKATIFAY